MLFGLLLFGLALFAFWGVIAVLTLVDFPSGCEIVTVEETTANCVGVGELRRYHNGYQYYVIDPVDGSRIWLKDNDDLYEDANYDVWRLID